MTELKSSLYSINESVETNTKRKLCSMGMIKYVGGIIFCMSISGISFLLGIKYQNHLEDNDGSL